MKVFLCRASNEPGAWAHQYEALNRAFDESVPRLHERVSSPQEADIIFLCNIDQPDGYRGWDHPLPAQFPEKCFALSEQWKPPFLIAGIYSNAPKRMFGKGRFRTGAYVLHHSDFKNPFVEAHQPGDMIEYSDRRYLSSFMGRDCHPIRTELLKMQFGADILVADASSFNAFSHDNSGKSASQRRYYDVCRDSKSLLCPRGVGPNSIRLFESLKMGICPIILADAWMPPCGIDWQKFAIFVPEDRVKEIEAVIRHHASEFEERGARAREAFEQNFAPSSYFNYLVASALDMKRSRIIPERLFIARRPLLRQLERVRHKAHVGRAWIRDRIQGK